MSLRAPLGRVLGLGSAKEGTDHWWGQRVSGVALVLLGLWFAGSLHGLGPLEHGAVLMFIATPLNTVLLSLLCLVVAWHSYLGVQVVIEDYLHVEWMKLTALLLVKFLCIVLGLLSALAVVRIAVGS